jgi:hypothetical protein
MNRILVSLTRVSTQQRQRAGLVPFELIERALPRRLVGPEA